MEIGMVETWKDQVCMAIKLLQQAWRRLTRWIQSLRLPHRQVCDNSDFESTR
jgi:hypothetical protein